MQDAFRKTLKFLSKSIIPNFQEMELSSSNIKKFQGMETPPKIPYISGKGNPKQSFLYFEKWNFSVHPRKNSYTSGNESPKKSCCILLKESCSNILEKGNPENFFVFQETELFLYFRKP